MQAVVSPLALAGLLLGAGVPAQDSARAEVEIEVHPVAEGVYLLTGRGGNIGVSIGADGAILIDDQYAPLTPQIQAALAKLGPQPARFVINTHWHGDHTGGNENFGKAGAVIVAHQHVRQRLSEAQFTELFNRRTPPSPKAALPVVTFTSDLTLHFNDEELHVFHVEHAHTDGDGLVHLRRANVVHMGDTFFNGSYPFIDTSAGGSIDGMIRAADRVLELADEHTKIIPGHGPLATRQELRQFRTMLATVRARVAALVRAGKTLEQTIAAAPTRDLDPVWGGGYFKPDQMVTMVYWDLARRGK